MQFDERALSSARALVRQTSYIVKAQTDADVPCSVDITAAAPAPSSEDISQDAALY